MVNGLLGIAQQKQSLCVRLKILIKLCRSYRLLTGLKLEVNKYKKSRCKSHQQSNKDYLLKQTSQAYMIPKSLLSLLLLLLTALPVWSAETDQKRIFHDHMVNVMPPNKTSCVSTQSAKMFSGTEGSTHKGSVNSQKSSDNPNWFVGYVGETQKGIPQGRGTYAFTNGSIYVGPFVNGQPNGTGVWAHPNGSTYVGKLKDGQPNGEGIWNYESGYTYIGEFADGQPNGFGWITHPDGYTYEGEFANGQLNGIGWMSYPGGSKYDGNWVAGMPHGYGTMSYPDGRIQAGYWKNNRFLGDLFSSQSASNSDYILKGDIAVNRLRKEEDCPGCDLSRANLKHLDLMGVAVNHADLAGADLRGSRLFAVSFKGANLRSANLRGANLFYANLTGANLQGANLCRASLVKAVLHKAKLKGANLRGANLSLAEGTDLEGAELCNTKMPDETISNRDC